MVARNKLLAIRVTTDEKLLFARAALRLGTTESGLVRDLIDPVIRVQRDIEADRQKRMPGGMEA